VRFKTLHPQAVLLAALREYWKGQIENPRMLDQLHAHAGVDGRHLVLPIERYYGLKNFGEFNRVWIEAAQELGEHAIRCAMSRAGLDLSQISALFFVSVTGVASPSIDARLINRMKLPTNLRRTPIFGLGVVGEGRRRRAADYVRAIRFGWRCCFGGAVFTALQRERPFAESGGHQVFSAMSGGGLPPGPERGREESRRARKSTPPAPCLHPDTEEVMAGHFGKGFRIVFRAKFLRWAFLSGPDVDRLLNFHGFSAPASGRGSAPGAQVPKPPRLLGHKNGKRSSFLGLPRPGTCLRHPCCASSKTSC
jgi:alkylresorcinol/alkylpyrone synthase